MKKIILFVIIVLLLLASFSRVMAGGDKVRGGTGIGEGDQNTNENACPDQPCFQDAPQPGDPGN